MRNAKTALLFCDDLLTVYNLFLIFLRHGRRRLEIQLPFHIRTAVPQTGGHVRRFGRRQTAPRGVLVLAPRLARVATQNPSLLTVE